MALPVNHPLDEQTVSCHTASSGGTPITAACRAPFRGKIVKLAAILAGTLTGDATCATTIAGTAITGGAFTLTASGSVAGTIFTLIPTGANIVNEDDAIIFPVTGGTGSSIPCTFTATIQAL